MTSYGVPNTEKQKLKRNHIFSISGRQFLYPGKSSVVTATKRYHYLLHKNRSIPNFFMAYWVLPFQWLVHFAVNYLCSGKKHMTEIVNNFFCLWCASTCRYVLLVAS